MKTAYFFVILITTSLLTSCEERISEPDISKTIQGSWLVTSEKIKGGNAALTEDDNGISTTTWGLGAITSIKLNSDNTFYLNVDQGGSSQTASHPGGLEIPSNTWTLNEQATTITFYSATEYVGLILRDTAQFQLTIDQNDQLILENEQVILRHRRIE